MSGACTDQFYCKLQENWQNIHGRVRMVLEFSHFAVTTLPFKVKGWSLQG